MAQARWILALALACGPIEPEADPATTSAASTTDAPATTDPPTTSNPPTSTLEPPPDTTTESPGTTAAACVDDLFDDDDDGVGNECDGCPMSPGKFSGHCCDPRFGTCVNPVLSTIRWICQPRDGEDGVLFECEVDACMLSNFGYARWANCPEGPHAPPGTLARLHPPPENPDWFDLADCDNEPCQSQWCTIGDDAVCGGINVCLPWYEPGEAPAGSETLGACARVDTGPCVGTVGRKCLTW